MAFSKMTDQMAEILSMIMKDIPKVQKGNKLATQRIRCATIELSKVSKKWRKMSLEVEKRQT